MKSLVVLDADPQARRAYCAHADRERSPPPPDNSETLIPHHSWWIKIGGRFWHAQVGNWDGGVILPSARGEFRITRSTLHRLFESSDGVAACIAKRQVINSCDLGCETSHTSSSGYVFASPVLNSLARPSVSGLRRFTADFGSDFSAWCWLTPAWSRANPDDHKRHRHGCSQRATDDHCECRQKIRIGPWFNSRHAVAPSSPSPRA